MLAFLGAALVGLVVPTGCVVVPEGERPMRESIKEFFVGCDGPCRCGRCGPGGGNECCSECEASCGLPMTEGATEFALPAPCEVPAAASAAPCDGVCEERPKLWHRLHFHHFHRLHFYDPEAGIFNFCVPPQCLNPPPPLPPGRFFPVPVQPAFAQRADDGTGSAYGYNMVGGAYSSGDCKHRPNSPCR